MTDQYSQSVEKEERIRRAQASQTTNPKKRTTLAALEALAAKRRGGPRVPAVNINEYIVRKGGGQYAEYGPTTEQISQSVPQQPAVKQLPYGAVGWDYNGNPYYGDGPAGYFNELRSKLLAPVANTPDWSDASLIDLGQVYHGWEGKRIYNPLDIIDIAAQKLQNQGVPGSHPTALGNISRGIGSLLNVAGTVLNQPAAEAEKLFGALGFGLEAAGTGSQFISPTEAIENLKRNVARPTNPYLKNMQDNAFKTMFALAHTPWNIPVLGYNLLRTVTAPTPITTKQQALEANWQAGRVLYSAWTDDAVRKEFIRRFEDGENPYMLARQLENPLHEMVGQTLLDPLWLLGSVLGAHKKAAAMDRMAAKFVKFNELTPEMEAALAAGEAFSTADTGNMLGKLNDMIGVQINRVDSGITNAAKKRNFFSLTADGKRFVSVRDAGEFGNWVISTAAESNMTSSQAMDVILGLAQKASKNPEERLQGIAKLKHWQGSMRPLFADPGVEFGLMMRKIVGETADGALDAERFLSEATALRGAGTAEEMAKMAEWLGKRVDNAAEKLFPSVDDMAEAVRKESTGAKLSAAEHAWAQEYKQLPSYIKAVSKINGGMQKYFYRPFNNMFATVYMGLNPGYMARNTINNYFTALVDEGPQVLLHSPKNYVQLTKDWLGGGYPMAAATGFSGPAAAAGIKTLHVGRIPSRLFRL